MIGLSDGLGTTLETQYRYEPYGKTRVLGQASRNTQQYTGRENDATGLYYYRARYYDPGTGRFVSPDPIGWAAGQTNGYAYVGGDPFGYRDPLGLNPAAGAAAGGAVGGAIGAWVGWNFTGPIVQDAMMASKPKPGSKLKNCPPGTIPIDQAKGPRGWDKDDVHGVKGGLEAGPQDWVGITPDGHVITGDHKGNAVDNGPVGPYLP